MHATTLYINTNLSQHYLKQPLPPGWLVVTGKCLIGCGWKIPGKAGDFYEMSTDCAGACSYC